MKVFNRISVVIVLTASFMFGIVSLSTAALAATTPPFGMVATYGVLSSTYTNTTAGTIINGDIGFTTGPAVVPAGTHTNY